MINFSERPIYSLKNCTIQHRLVFLSSFQFESKKGDTPSSINCYMHETGASEDEARQHIKFLISEAWKQTNEDQAAKSPFSQKFIEFMINGNRMTLWFYDGRDGYGVEYMCKTKDCASSFFFEPIPSESYDQND